MTKARLEELYNISAPTWEGLKIEGLEEQLKEIDPEVTFEVCSGADMNKAYKLTNSNAYPDDLNIVILTHWSIPMMSWKFNYGCRWLDDVIDNNKYRQQEINKAHA